MNTKLVLLIVFLISCLNLAEAQQPKKIPRIGYITLASASSNLPRREAFLEGLRGVGYVEGQNIKIDYRYADNRSDRVPHSQPIWCV
jgi:putative ABC transport system substrate-binding protein